MRMAAIEASMVQVSHCSHPTEQKGETSRLSYTGFDMRHSCVEGSNGLYCNCPPSRGGGNATGAQGEGLDH